MISQKVKSKFDRFVCWSWSFAAFPIMVLALVVFLFWKDAIDMEKHHCKESSITRQSMYMQFIYDSKGNITGSFPVFYTENLYLCDDHSRWR